jgi:hypothetical protein
MASIEDRHCRADPVERAIKRRHLPVEIPVCGIGRRSIDGGGCHAALRRHGDDVVRLAFPIDEQRDAPRERLAASERLAYRHTLTGFEELELARYCLIRVGGFHGLAVG